MKIDCLENINKMSSHAEFCLMKMFNFTFSIIMTKKSMWVVKLELLLVSEIMHNKESLTITEFVKQDFNPIRHQTVTFRTPSTGFVHLL